MSPVARRCGRRREAQAIDCVQGCQAPEISGRCGGRQLLKSSDQMTRTARLGCAGHGCMAIAGFGLALASSAPAAVVQKVNKDHDKIVVELSQPELAVLEEDEVVLFEFGKDRSVAPGKIVGLNVV